MIPPYYGPDHQEGSNTTEPSFSPANDDDDSDHADISFIATIILIVILVAFMFFFCILINRLLISHPEGRRNGQPANSNKRTTTGLDPNVIHEQLEVREYENDDDNVTTASRRRRSSSRSSSSSSSTVVVAEKKQVEAVDRASTPFRQSKGKADDEVHCCAICFNALREEPVCYSNNLACQHVFHETCMVTWLQKFNECPVCRQTYLILKESV